VLKALLLALAMGAAQAQVAPSPSELAAYTGLFAAAAKGDAAAIARLASAGEKVNAKDGRGRTPLHVAAFMKQRDAMKSLVGAGADANALDADRYDAVTIAAVADDPATMGAALELGNRATNVTSRYDGTALIAAAHLGHVEVVRMLIKAGAPLDHVNNLGWTALIESIVLGDGGTRHTATLAALVEAGANVDIADRQGLSPLHLAEARGYREMAEILKAAGAK
jgi:ankyrin repeat protein